MLDPEDKVEAVSVTARLYFERLFWSIATNSIAPCSGLLPYLRLLVKRILIVQCWTEHISKHGGLDAEINRIVCFFVFYARTLQQTIY